MRQELKYAHECEFKGLAKHVHGKCCRNGVRLLVIRVLVWAPWRGHIVLEDSRTTRASSNKIFLEKGGQKLDSAVG